MTYGGIWASTLDYSERASERASGTAERGPHGPGERLGLVAALLVERDHVAVEVRDGGAERCGVDLGAAVISFKINRTEHRNY
jgi:hypothetical protein